MAEQAGQREESKKRKSPEAISGVSKIIELQAESSKSWEEAVQLCLAEAVRTVRNISNISVDQFTASVNEDSIQMFQVKCKIAFAIDDRMRSH
ncbi:MAG: dodecin family protein [Pseudomonadota bacterium]|jgi:flavin-binding protein dodecin